MPKQTFSLQRAEPLLDIVSYGRGGPRGEARLSQGQLEHIRRTVQRVPEAVVKVLPRDSNDLKAAGKHLDYIGRYGKLDLETDDGERIQDRDAGRRLLEDWDLDIDDVRRQADLASAKGRNPPKLVHKLMFSMPAGTPPKKVLEAVRNFAREEFAFKHRYAFVLHTDEDHPHVHLVLKAVSEQGLRLNIKKAMLRHWRSEFARNLRLLGVAANATERAVRGEARKAKQDGIYRANLRGDSRHTRKQVEAAAAELLKGNVSGEAGKATLLQTRREIEKGWQSIANSLDKDGRTDLAKGVRQFVNELPPVRTEREWVRQQLLEIYRQPRQRETKLSR